MIHTKVWRSPVSLLVLLLSTMPFIGVYCQIDTLTHRQIDEVTVSADYSKQSAAATQRINIKQINRSTALQISDVAKLFAGVQIKDFGGVGGLKTISVRSLGSNHTAVSYNGIALSDAQNGQIDLSRISMEGVGSLSLINGKSDQILQPAKLAASGSILHIESAPIAFTEGRLVQGSASIQAGSFSLVHPSLNLQFRLHPQHILSWSIDGLYTKGDYPYSVHYGGSKDSTARKKRSNSEVYNIKTDLALYSDFNKGGKLQSRFYWYQSAQQLPGAVILYNEFSSQYLDETSGFLQLSYQNNSYNRWRLRADMKINGAYQHYVDPHYGDRQYENRFRQWEYYLSVGGEYHLLEGLYIALNTDGFVNTLDADQSLYINPIRTTWLTTLGLRYQYRWLSVSATALQTMIWEHHGAQPNSAPFYRLSPHLAASIKPIQSENFYIRAMYKQTFRMPTFNDLYYQGIGNPKLKPESAHLLNLGLTYHRSLCPIVSNIGVTADLFYHYVYDKIVAVPSKNIFVWSMLNLGIVETIGCDLGVNITLKINKKIALELRGNYTIQQAQDMTSSTDPALSRYYQGQIPYTPLHSGSGSATLITPYIDINYTMIGSGQRFALGENSVDNLLPAYSDHSICLSKSFPIGQIELGGKIDMINLANNNYEVVKSFPMPGRQFRGTITLKF